MSRNPALDDVYRALYRGWSLLPVHGVVDGTCTCGHPHDGSANGSGEPLKPSSVGKHPIPRRGSHDASTDPAVIEAALLDPPWCNYGVATGSRSALVVLDLDGPEAEREVEALAAKHGKLPDTYTVRTGRDAVSRHLYLRIPDGESLSGRKLPGCPHVDVRAEGGYVIGAGSRHRTGVTYEADGVAEVADAPGWLCHLLRPQGAEKVTAKPMTAAQLAALDVPESVTQLLGESIDPPRYVQHWRLVGACIDAGLPDAAILALVTRHKPSTDKFGRRLEEQTRRAIGKLRRAHDERAHDDEEDRDAPADDFAAPDGRRLTDVGNASRLIEQGGGHLRYVHSWGKWLVYRTGRWVIDNNDALVTEVAKKVAESLLRQVPAIADKETRTAVYKWALRSETSGAIAAMIRLARGVDGVLVEHEDLDADPHLLNVANGTVDLRTGRLRAHDPADLCTMQAATAYDQAAVAPLWTACLDRWQPDGDVRRYLQVEAGAAATGHPTETISVHHGSGGNGKSKFWGAVQAVLGDYAVVPHKSLLVAQKHEQHATVVASMFRARLAVAAETGAGDRLDDEQVKALTGGDRLQARRMREDEWSFWPSHTVVMFSNYRPKVRGRDEGIWRRLRLIEWEVTIPEDERDEHLAAKLRGEAAGILRWVVDGARTFLAEGLNPPEAVRSATSRYRSAEDVVGRFVGEVLEVGNGFARSADIKAELERWCTEQGLRLPQLNEVTAVLEARGCQSSRRVIDGKRSVVWDGVSVTSEFSHTRSDQGER